MSLLGRRGLELCRLVSRREDVLDRRILQCVSKLYKSNTCSRFSSSSRNAPLSTQFQEQCATVQGLILHNENFDRDHIKKTVLDYYNNYGMNKHHFEISSPDAIAAHVQCILAANLLHRYSKEEFFPVIHQEHPDQVLIISRASIEKRAESQNFIVEKMIESKYLNLDGSKPSWRLQSYRSEGSIFDSTENLDQRLRTCILEEPKYPVSPNELTEEEKKFDLSKIGDETFYSIISQNKKSEAICSQLNREVMEDPTDLGLKVHSAFAAHKNMWKITFAFRNAVGLKNFYSSLGDIITAYGLYSQEKYVEPLSNGVTLITCYLRSLNDLSSYPEIANMSYEDRINEMIQAVDLRHMLPSSFYYDMVLKRKLNCFEAVYCHAASAFTTQFSQSVGHSFQSILRILQRYDLTPSQQDLYDVQSRLRKATSTETTIQRVISKTPHLVKKIYTSFRLKHGRHTTKAQGQKVADHANIYSDEALLKEIQQLGDEESQQVLQWLIRFNNSILKTNFFKSHRKALSFRCDPKVFLSDADFPQEPTAVIFFIGNQFKGFHARFADVARGGLRVVMSKSDVAFHQNSQRAFDELYKLSKTQHHKNKDIPEGGSKGIILLDPTKNAQEASELVKSAFKRYIEALLDILLPHEQVVDHVGNPEICFLGPDEHTGSGRLMDWACLHARHRGAPFWKAFTTGKDKSLGGIPHDIYGMTTLSVETYLKRVLEKMNIKEEEATKCQTGGPDGDLGSNAILRSKTKLTSLIDGDGVLHDPEGLNRSELLQLVERRQKGLPTSSAYFDESKLSSKGFRVLCSDRNIRLPDGTLVESGLHFRNSFHLHPLAKATVFNPCGGRPESITPNNVHQCFDENGKPLYKLIVEGANVFITDEARIYLEKKGIPVFKDASTNKGGVTSSSMEVLVALALDDQQFQEMMCCKSDQVSPPQFYQDYVKAVQAKIVENANKEFELLWSLGQKTRTPMSILSDQLSQKIIDLKTEILKSSLWDDVTLKNAVFCRSLPSVLMPKVISLETFFKRVPEQYCKAIFATYIASHFVYDYGISASPVEFMTYINSLKRISS